jgi:hypothetical protein
MNRGAIVFRPEGSATWRPRVDPETDPDAIGRHSHALRDYPTGRTYFATDPVL